MQQLSLNLPDSNLNGSLTVEKNMPFDDAFLVRSQKWFIRTLNENGDFSDTHGKSSSKKRQRIIDPINVQIALLWGSGDKGFIGHGDGDGGAHTKSTVCGVDKGAEYTVVLRRTFGLRFDKCVRFFFSPKEAPKREWLPKATILLNSLTLFQLVTLHGMLP